jgi:SpoIID/LytB domain protein
MGCDPVKEVKDKSACLFTDEPEILVGLIEGVRKLRGCFHGPFLAGDGGMDGGKVLTGPFSAAADEGGIIFTDEAGLRTGPKEEMRFKPAADGTFTLSDVTIGVRFHWERKQDQTFQGDLAFLANPDESLTVVNRLRLEAYLTSVISSEMSAESPPEMLKAHAVASRSWLMAMLRKRGNAGQDHARPGRPAPEEKRFGKGDSSVAPGEAGKGDFFPAPAGGHRRQEAAVRPDAFGQAEDVLRWYGREDHTRFDVCADDHCQRYQGVTKIISAQAAEAVRATRGVFLVFDGEICDARYSKACGGRTEDFENTWEETPIPYLVSVVDADVFHPPVDAEAAARTWVRTRPEAHCNTTDRALLRRILPDFDQETTDFFRWRVVYEREELEAILAQKSGVDFGVLQNLVPVARGPSGRIIRLRIEGTKQTVTVGKELEIRRWLSRSHLYSSAFSVSEEHDADGLPVRFTLDGAGWGHGVGLCQIGAAVMAAKGHTAEEILKHYFRGAELTKMYD